MIEAIIFMVVLALAGSILWVLPSPGQRRKASLRSKALALGLSVRFSDKTFTTIIDGEEYEDSLICYSSRPVTNGVKDYEVTLMQLWRGKAYEWELKSCRNFSEAAVDVIKNSVDSLGEGKIHGVTLYQSGYRFYWLENTDEQSLIESTRSLGELWERCNKLA